MEKHICGFFIVTRLKLLTTNILCYWPMEMGPNKSARPKMSNEINDKLIQRKMSITFWHDTI